MILSAAALALAAAVAEARICSQAAPCRFGVASCTEATFAPTCSYILNNQRSFPSQMSAINACTTKFGPGASLVTPGDAATNGAVKNLCPSHRFFDMKRRAGNNCLQWETLDGSAQITYFQWDSGEPSRGGCPQGEGCAGFKISVGNGGWHDSQCTPSGASDTFVAQCVVCALPPTPAPTPIAAPTVPPTTLPPLPTFTEAPTPPPSPPVLVPAPTTPQPILIGVDTKPISGGGAGGTRAPLGSGAAPGSANNVTAGDGELSGAALGGLIGGIICCLLCLLVLLVLLVRRRDKKSKEEKQLAVIMQPTARYATQRPTEVGQYGASPVAGVGPGAGATFNPFNQPPPASWNGAPPGMFGGAGGGSLQGAPPGMFGGGSIQGMPAGAVGNSAMFYSAEHDPLPANSGVFMTAGAGLHDTMLSAREEPRTLPVAAYFPATNGQHYLPEPPRERPLPNPAEALAAMNNQWSMPGAQYDAPTHPFGNSGHFQPAAAAESFSSTSLRSAENAQSVYGLTNLIPGGGAEPQEAYGNLDLAPSIVYPGLPPRSAAY